MAVTAPSPVSDPFPPSRTTAPTPLLPVDLLLLGYSGVVAVVALTRMGRHPGMGWLLAAHALLLPLLSLVRRPGLGAVGRTLRETYPLFLLAGLYAELEVLNGLGVPVHDVTIRQWEILLFGGEISRTWWQAMPSRVWSTVLHGAYVGYYFIVSGPALYFAVRGEWLAVRRFVLAVMGTFVVCYLCFLFFPVAGPYYVYPRPAMWFLDNPTATLVYTTLASGSSYGAAFPSSHVAATVAATIATGQSARRLGLVLVLPTVLLILAVVYCQMHYAVDALAGLAVGIAVPVATGRWLTPEKTRGAPTGDSPSSLP